MLIRRGVHALADQNLPSGGLSTQPLGEIRHRSDSRVVEAFLKADDADRRVALCDSDRELQVVPEPPPSLGQLLETVAHRHRHSRCLRRRVRARERVVEEHHDAVAGKTLEGPIEAADQVSERSVVLAQDGHEVLGLDRLREGGEAAQVAEQHGDLAAMAGEERVVARRRDDLDDLGRKEAFQAPHPLELVDLLAHALLEHPVPFRQLGRLRLNSVVVLLDSDQRTDTREQFGLVERLDEEVIRTRLDRLHLRLVAVSCDHHDRQKARGGLLAQLSTDLIPVDARHDDVKQDEVRLASRNRFESLLARSSGHDHVAAG